MLRTLLVPQSMLGRGRSGTYSSPVTYTSPCSPTSPRHYNGCTSSFTSSSCTPSPYLTPSTYTSRLTSPCSPRLSLRSKSMDSPRVAREALVAREAPRVARVAREAAITRELREASTGRPPSRATEVAAGRSREGCPGGPGDMKETERTRVSGTRESCGGARSGGREAEESPAARAKEVTVKRAGSYKEARSKEAATWREAAR